MLIFSLFGYKRGERDSRSGEKKGPFFIIKPLTKLSRALTTFKKGIMDSTGVIFYPWKNGGHSDTLSFNSISDSSQLRLQLNLGLFLP